MSARRIEVHFNEFFPMLWEQAQRQGLNKGSWMAASNLGPQRWSEFAKASGIPSANNAEGRDVSGFYFLRLIGGLGLRSEEIEGLAGRRFTEDQRRELQFNGWIKANKDDLQFIMQQPKLQEAVRQIIKAFRKDD